MARLSDERMCTGREFQLLGEDTQKTREAKDDLTQEGTARLVAQHSKIEIRRNCFAVRVVAPWNSLPEFVVSSTNVQMFESRLDKVWSNQPVRFCYKEELRL